VGVYCRELMTQMYPRNKRLTQYFPHIRSSLPTDQRQELVLELRVGYEGPCITENGTIKGKNL